MEITYLGHSAFRLRGKEVTVLTDPFPANGASGTGKLQADIITVSQADSSRCFLPTTDDGQRVVSGPGEYEVGGVLIAGVATKSQPGEGPINTAYVFRFDDLVVCHLGGLTSKLSDEQVEEIGNIDVLLVPVGGHGMLGPNEAAEVVSQLEPTVVVPMEYRVEGLTPDLEPVDHFCREMGTKEVVPEARLNVTRSSLPSEVRVVVLENKRG